MLRVTKMTDYASMLLACLAQAPAKVHSASELAELARLELPTVSKVLKPLSRAGLTLEQGPTGWMLTGGGREARSTGPGLRP